MNDWVNLNNGGVACNAPIVVMTEDGSHSLLAPALGEQYHSTHGAVQESMHVFIEAAFRTCRKTEVRVLEIGFGAGLNAFLTLLETEKGTICKSVPTKEIVGHTDSHRHRNDGMKVYYTALELYPIEPNTACSLNYPELLSSAHRAEFERLHRAAWEADEPITPRFTLRKMQADFTQYAFTDQAYDVIYFDAFSPEKQPEMWSEQLFVRLYEAATPDAALTTYCAKGTVRRAMTQAGFVVERLTGAAGKREMLRGKKGF